MTLTSDDTLSGVDAHLLRHRRRRRGRSTTEPVEIIGEGTTTIEYYSVDVVGNAEAAEHRDSCASTTRRR